MSSPHAWCVRVARELLRVELARCGDQVEDRLLGLDPEHDRRVPELQVEVDQQRLPLLVLRERAGEVGGEHGLARAALRREDGDDPPVVRAGGGGPAAGVGRLADREDHVLGQRGQQDDIGDVGPERLVEQERGLAGRDEQHRYPRVLADQRQVVHRQRRGAGRVQDAVEVTACERGRPVLDLLARTDDLEVRLLPERVAEGVEAVTGAGQVDPGAGLSLAVLGVLGVGHHGPTPSPRPLMSCRTCGLGGAELGAGVFEVLPDVGRMGRRPKREEPVAVLDEPVELRRLRVRDLELDGELLVGAGRQVGVDRRVRRRPQHEEVAEDDPAHVMRGGLGERPRADDVDAVTGLQRPREELVGVARDLHCPLRARDRCADASCGLRREPPGAHLLAGERRLGGDEAGELRSVRDRAGHDRGAGDADRAQQVLLRHFHAGRAGRNVVRGHEDRDVAGPMLDVTFVIRHVVADHDRRQYGERDGDPYIADSIRHSPVLPRFRS